ncbi:MAG: c-type cytochrome [Polaromonas sp.]
MRIFTFLFFGAIFSGALGATPVNGNVARGEQIYTRCFACHALAQDRTGPRHCGLFGRKAGTVAGFEYSSAMKKSGIVWNEKTLNGFLANPVKTVPGTAMGYSGVTDAQERADLIAYLKQATQPGKQCP